MKWQQYKAKIEESGLPEDWYIIGIDLGTTNSIISYWDNLGSKPETIDISNGFGKIPLPSVVQYRNEGEEGEWIIGEEAYRSIKIYPETTIRSIKRQMGTNKTVNIGGKEYLPEEISSKILIELIENCQNLNPKAEIAGLVVSVPYDFDDAAKRATMKACEIAGLKDKLICLIEEPKAAALAYNYRSELKLDEKIMVFDFGGGTLDITIFHITEKNESYIKLKVISEGGAAYHGGDNVDEAVINLCNSYINKKLGNTSEDISIENQVEISLRARETKERLSGIKNYRIPFTFCVPPFVEQITREDFEAQIEPFINKTRNLVLKALRECYEGPLMPTDINRVLLEGGSSQMPWVKDMLINIFNTEELIYVSERPALDISTGATYYAAMKMGLLDSKEVETERMSVEFEVTVPHDIGFEIINGEKKSFFTMIRRGTVYSLAKKSHIFILSGESEVDMTNLDLKIVERINKEDDIEKCKTIGEIQIKNLPRRPSGKTKLSITLSIQEEGGIVKGSVVDLGFDNEYEPSGFKVDFDPSRFKKTILEG
jgi:molecular chaperone DnaK